jgi:hypothetical protein
MWIFIRSAVRTSSQKEPYHEAIAEAASRTWIVEFTAAHDAFEKLHLGAVGSIKLRGWYIEGKGVDDGNGARTRALIVISAGGGNQLTAIQNLADQPYTIDPATDRIAENHFPNATTEGFGMARWRQILHRLNEAGFDVLAYDRRGEGLSGGFSDPNTLEQSADIFKALEQGRECQAEEAAGRTDARFGSAVGPARKARFWKTRAALEEAWAAPYLQRPNFPRDRRSASIRPARIRCPRGILLTTSNEKDLDRDRGWHLFRASR